MATDKRNFLVFAILLVAAEILLVKGADPPAQNPYSRYFAPDKSGLTIFDYAGALLRPYAKKLPPSGETPPLDINAKKEKLKLLWQDQHLRRVAFHHAKIRSTCETYPFCNHIPAPPPLLPSPAELESLEGSYTIPSGTLGTPIQNSPIPMGRTFADPNNKKLRRTYRAQPLQTPFIRENVNNLEEAALNRKPFGQLVHDAPNTVHDQSLTVAKDNQAKMSKEDNAHMQDILGADFARPMADVEQRNPPSVTATKKEGAKAEKAKEEAQEHKK